jgi:hypothetical protein
MKMPVKIDGVLAYPPPVIDASQFSYDDYHINKQRKHDVTEAEAKAIYLHAH